MARSTSAKASAKAPAAKKAAAETAAGAPKRARAEAARVEPGQRRLQVMMRPFTDSSLVRTFAPPTAEVSGSSSSAAGAPDGACPLALEL
eukprot:15454324-Alexandrium_andersonii.AAC.1